MLFAENVPPVLAHRSKLDLRYRLTQGSNNVKAFTALEYLSELKVDSFPLVELLNKIGLGLQIYNSKLNEMESWTSSDLIGGRTMRLGDTSVYLIQEHASFLDTSCVYL